MKRLSFLSGLIAASIAAPLFGMPKTYPTLYGDGKHDDTSALQAMIDGRPYYDKRRRFVRVNTIGTVLLPAGIYVVSQTIDSMGRMS